MEATRPHPVITCLGQALLAVHPDTGELQWSRVLERPLRRLVVVWHHLFFAEQGRSSVVTWIDVHTGETRGSVDAGFDINAALADGTRVYFAGPRGMMCLTSDGSLVFRVALEPGEVAGFAADDREMWRIVSGGAPGPGALLVGDQIAQPDIDT